MPAICDTADLITRRPRTRRMFTDTEMGRMLGLYHDQSLPLTQVAAEFAVPVSTLLRWVAEMDWPRRSSVTATLPAPAAPPLAAPDGPAADDWQPEIGLFSLNDICFDIIAAARRQLRALASDSHARTPAGQANAARVLASLTQTIERAERCHRILEDWGGPD